MLEGLLHKRQGCRCKVVAGIFFSFKTRIGIENMWTSGVFLKSGETFLGISELFLYEESHGLGTYPVDRDRGLLHGGPCGFTMRERGPRGSSSVVKMSGGEVGLA
jgi:hypothetical protein